MLLDRVVNLIPRLCVVDYHGGGKKLRCRVIEDCDLAFYDFDMVSYIDSGVFIPAKAEQSLMTRGHLFRR